MKPNFRAAIFAVALLGIAPNAITAQIVSPPTLISPSAGVFMDNGCGDRSDSIDWDFEWTAVSGAKKYHLFVKTSRAPLAAIDDKGIKKTKYEYRKPGAYTGPRGYLGWTWKVRALVGNEWTEWSEERPFVMEPVNTDCR